MTRCKRVVRTVLRVGGLLLVALGLLALGACVAGSAAYGQAGPHDVRPFDLGGVANAEGHDALLANPARLAYADRDARLVVTVGDVRAYAGGDLLQMHHYERAFVEGRTLADDEAAALLDAWFGRQRRGARVFAEVVPLAVSRRAKDGRWALGGAVRMRSMAATRLDRGLFDLILRGTEAGRTVPINGRFRTYAMTDVTVAYSRRLGRDLWLGVAPRIVVGGTFADGYLDSSLEIRDDALTHDFSYEARAAGPLSTDVFDAFNAFASAPLEDVALPHPFRQIAGTGFGIDVGASYAIGDFATVAASLTDVGLVRWRQDAQRFTPANNRFRYDGVALDRSRIQDEYGGRLGRYFRHELDSLARDAYAEVEREREAFTTPLPAALHLGIAGHIPGTSRPHLRLGLSAGHRALRNTTLHVSAKERVGAVPLHVGARIGADHALALGFSTGLDTRHYRFSVGALVTPLTSGLGAGGRYALRLSLATLRF